MLFRVEPSIFRTFPGALIGIVVALGLDNEGASEEMDQLLRRAEQESTRRLRGADVTQHPRIAPWRAAYRRFGAKPKKHISSVESLARRVLRGERLHHINKLVDVYNAVSLLHLLPVGGEDLDCIVGDVHLAFAGEEEPLVRLLGERDERAPRPGEVIYKDCVGALCRRWNWKEADRTKLTGATTRALLVIEALPPTGREELVKALSDVSLQVRRHCGGETRTAIVDEASPQTELGTD